MQSRHRSLRRLPNIEGNLITNNTGNKISGQGGIRISNPDATPNIYNNTISYNSVGINILNSPSPIINSNNIQDNLEYNLYLLAGLGATTSKNISAIYNWWGTSDPSEISQTIWDQKNDFNLGSVVFAPFLNQSNPMTHISWLPPRYDLMPSPTPIPP